jgi:serine/threonine-protein kinase
MAQKFRKGSRLGKYRLDRRLGEGGSAAVWSARDTIEGRRVALKIILPSVVAEYGREAVEHEARTATKLVHPRIVAVRNADWIDSCFVLVTELAKTSLDQSPGVRRSPTLALAILRDVSEGLAYAHERGLIHRDIKPGNIFLFDDRRAKLGDFGTARLAPVATRKITEAGTFGYMAPEQAYGRPRFASDVFSLSLTAYEMFTGVLPGWPFEWPFEGMERFTRRCPKEVQPIIRKGLQLDLKKRWRDGIEFHRALVHAIEHARRDARARHATARRKTPASKRKQRAGDPFELETAWFRKHHGKAFDARFDCHACDGPIAESMTHCPWCGTTRNSFREVTSYPLVCPDCERGVRAEWSACPKCSTGRFQSNGRKIPADRRAERTCRRPGCGTPIHRFMHYCPKCKLKVARPWKIAGLESCKRCRWPVASRWRFCAWCGKKNASALDVTVGRKRR